MSLPLADAAVAAITAAAAFTDLKEVASGAALLFLVGGLSMLALIVVLVVLQSLLPDRSGRADAAGRRQLRPVESGSSASWLNARSAAADRKEAARHGHLDALAVPAVDQAMDQVVAMGLGEPRLLRVQPDLAQVRLYGCVGCTPPSGADGGGHPGLPALAPVCAAQTDGLASAFHGVFGGRTTAQETSCRARGDAACEFEVRH